MNKFRYILVLILLVSIFGQYIISQENYFIVKYIDIEEEMPIGSDVYNFEVNNPDYRTLKIKDNGFLKDLIELIKNSKQYKIGGTPDVKIKIISDSLKTPICIGYNLIQYDTFIVRRQDIFDWVDTKK